MCIPFHGNCSCSVSNLPICCPRFKIYVIGVGTGKTTSGLNLGTLLKNSLEKSDMMQCTMLPPKSTGSSLFTPTKWRKERSVNEGRNVKRMKCVPTTQYCVILYLVGTTLLLLGGGV